MILDEYQIIFRIISLRCLFIDAQMSIFFLNFSFLRIAEQNWSTGANVTIVIA